MVYIRCQHDIVFGTVYVNPAEADNPTSAKSPSAEAARIQLPFCRNSTNSVTLLQKQYEFSPFSGHRLYLDIPVLLP